MTFDAFVFKYLAHFAEVNQIFKDKCIKCHGASKQKGDYRLDDKHIAFAGGESGEAAIVTDNAMASNLVRLITLPEGHDDIMPPDGKGFLTPKEVMTVINWINTGASWDGVPVEIRPEVKEAPPTPSPKKPTGDVVWFSEHIEPLIEKHCIKCHKAPYTDERGKRREPKGDLRLDTKEHIMAGGENGKIIIPGKPEESTFYTLTIRDPDDDDIMPAKGDPLTKEETELIRKWILSGASFDNWSRQVS